MTMLRRAMALACLVALSGCNDGQGTARESGVGGGRGAPCPTNLQEVAVEVFQPSCLASGCHGSNDRAGGLDLETSALELQLFGREAALCGGEVRVVPGNAASSHLIAKLRGTSDCGAQMPIGGELAVETIDCVAAWIEQLDASSACETCGGTACIDLQADAQHCGSCGQACGGTAMCVDGGCACPGDLSSCASGCVDLNSDPGNCGSCGMGCGDSFCLQGGCSADCGALTECGGACVDLLSNSNHCGACGEACGPGASCFDGQCQCGSTTVSFASDVQPIFSAGCASMGCHDGVGGPGRPGGPGGGGTSLDLTMGNSYQSLLAETTSCGPVVAPGDVEGSLLIGKLTGAALCMGGQMPKGDPPLGPELIDTIATWICQGAKNN
jgi:hypothetical protein